MPHFFFGLVAKSIKCKSQLWPHIEFLCRSFCLGVFVKAVPQLMGDCWLTEKEGVPKHSSDKSIKKSLFHDSFKEHLKSIS